MKSQPQAWWTLEEFPFILRTRQRCSLKTKELDGAGLWRWLMRHGMMGWVIRVNRAFHIQMCRHGVHKGAQQSAIHMIDSTDLCIWYDNFLEIAGNHLVPTKSGYYDNFLTDERKMFWGRVLILICSKVQNGLVVALKDSIEWWPSSAHPLCQELNGAKEATDYPLPLEWVLYVVWADKTQDQFSHCNLVRTSHWQLPVNWQVKIIWQKWDLSRLWDLLKSITLPAQSILKHL